MFRNRLLTIALVLPLAACVSKGTHTAVTGQLDECKQDKQIAQDAARQCQERFDQESELWASVGATVNEAMPKAMKEFEQERDRIIEMVPDQVKSEVDGYLDDFAKAVSKSFGILRKDNERLMAEVQTNRERLAEVGGLAESIDTRVGKRMSASDAARDRMVGDAREIITLIQEWDVAYVNDRKSDTKLGLNRKERETITNFHAEVIAMLNTLSTQSDAVDTDAGASEGEAAEEAAGDEGEEESAEEASEETVGSEASEA